MRWSVIIEESAARASVDARDAQGVQIGDGGVQVNVYAARPRTFRPWMAPALPGPLIARPDLSAALFDGVTRDDAGPTTLTTAIEGAGGFGKTTLAALLCQDPRVAERFTGGLLWVTVGERRHGARLAELIGGLCEMLSGDGVKTADPQVAGGRLGELLDARDATLMVVDDVWRPEQLAPFMIGGRACRRLVTTRNSGVAPRRGVSVFVDVMTDDQAIAALTEGVGEVPRDLLGRLVAATGRWPLLLSLVNAALLDQLAAGADVRQAVQWVLRQLRSGGPAMFDLDPGDEDDRSHAIAATVDASLALLTPHERSCYFDLAIIPEDSNLPSEILFRLWRTTGGLSATEAEKLRARLVRLRLVQPGWRDGAPAVRLHDIIGSFLRHRLTGKRPKPATSRWCGRPQSFCPPPGSRGRAGGPCPGTSRTSGTICPTIWRAQAGRKSATPWCATSAGWRRKRRSWVRPCLSRPTWPTCPPASPGPCGERSGR